VGAVIARGDTVYRVDQRRVPLLYGSIPLYRTLSTGSRATTCGSSNGTSSALGYTGFTVDDNTRRPRLRRTGWQKDLGQDGPARCGRATPWCHRGHVASPSSLPPGAAAAGVLLKWTGTDPGRRHRPGHRLRRPGPAGAAAVVELPDGGKAPAKVTAIGTPTSNAKGDGATVPVELTVTDQRKLGRYQIATVKVELAAETHANVLPCPSNALVARPGGGYAVVTGGRYLPSRPACSRTATWRSPAPASSPG
jgi:hypothetical protein